MFGTGQLGRTAATAPGGQAGGGPAGGGSAGGGPAGGGPAASGGPGGRATAGGLLTLGGVIYHAAVRELRRGHRNALAGLIVTILQTLLLVLVFYAVFSLFGLRGAAIRGDFLLYVLTGVFLYMGHVKAVGAVLQAEGLDAPIMKHAPMNPLIAIAAAALAALYVQVLALGALLLVYHAAVAPLRVDQPAGAMGMVLVAWFSGVGVGMLFQAARPWAPALTQLVSQVYVRANMIASGKMFVANTMPGFLLPWFAWNPLFHTIDQARGFTFINYVPMHSSALYPVWVGLALAVLGLAGAYQSRRHGSLSRLAGG